MTEYNGASVYSDAYNGGIFVTLHQDPPPRDEPRQRGRLALSWEDARHLAAMILAMVNEEETSF